MIHAFFYVAPRGVALLALLFAGPIFLKFDELRVRRVNNRRAQTMFHGNRRGH